MNWNRKNSMLWDWENLAPFGPTAMENPKHIPHSEPRALVAGATNHGSTNSSRSTFTSSSELANGSSKSSMSASFESSSKLGNTLEFRFASVKGHGKNTYRDGEAVRVEDPGTSPASLMSVSNGEPILVLKLGRLRRLSRTHRIHTVRLKAANLICLLRKITIASTNSVKLILRLPRWLFLV